jgi:hypothetical protein
MEMILKTMKLSFRRNPAILTHVELEASASSDTLAAAASLGLISLIILSDLAIISLIGSSASFIHRLISLIGVIGLGLICLNFHFSILGCIDCIGLVCSIGTSGISRLAGCNGHISLVGLGGFGGGFWALFFQQLTSICPFIPQ